MNHNIPAPPQHPLSGKSAILWTKNLEKSYGKFAIGPIDLAFFGGDTIALLGKNGAGKTTLFEMLSGHLDCSQGQIFLGGSRVSPEATGLKRRLGYLPQHPRLPLWVTCHNLLQYAAALYQIPNPEKTVDTSETYWDCSSYRHKPLGALSYGMQKRVGLALATLHNPEVLILDEPHSGLDIFHSRALDDAIKSRAKNGQTTVISTHVAAFAAAVCDRVIALEAGHIEDLALWSQSDFVQRIQLIEERFFTSTTH